jgi:mRNA-degrading endonuclease RelE of RelBE toxin-antitoxin system
MISLQIEKSFHRAWGALKPEPRAQVGDFLRKFLEDPSQPSLSLERLDRIKNKGLWSARVTKGYRAIFSQNGDQYALLYVDQHDDAYAWAKAKRAERNDRTGELQIFTIAEVVEVPAVSTAAKAATKTKGLFDDAEDDYLLSLGLPPEWLPTMRKVKETTQLESVLKGLPEELAERLERVACGELVTPPPPAPAGPAAFETPEARRRYFVIHDASEIDELRDKPIEAWMRYLHPSQRSLVEATFSGPAKVTGAAGTGKTVVAMHRARALAAQGKRVLLTSFVGTLCRNLDRSMSVLCKGEEKSRIDVMTVDAAAAAIHKLAGAKSGFATDDDVQKGIERYAFYATSVGDAEFLWNEWQQVIDAQALVTWDEYRDADRRGRGRALGAADRKKAWECFQRVLSQLEAARQFPHSVWLRKAEELVRTGKVPNRWDAVIVDEVQDLAPAALRFLSALAAKEPGNFLLVGDGGQRIYRNGASLRSAGIEVRGRSRVLKLNYRNTRQIQAASELLLLSGADDLDEGTDDRKGTLSPLGGPEPVFRGFPNRPAMYEHFVSETKKLLAQGLAPKEIAVFAHSKSLVSAAADALAAAKIEASPLEKDTDLASVKGVNVGTMHRAKGLEFKAVFVLGVEDSVVPPATLVAKTKEPADLEALLVRERNLLYVALTRARDEAWVLWSGTPSRFLAPVLDAGKGSQT